MTERSERASAGGPGADGARGRGPGDAMKVSALVVDVMDRSRFPEAVTFVRRAEDLDGEADVVVVDLARPGSVDAVRALRAAGSQARVVAYGSHVERDVLAEAKAAGCDRVLARSAFFADVAGALG